MFLRSIRWRLQLWHGTILLLVLGGFGFTAFELQRTRDLRRLDQELHERLGVLMSAMRPNPGLAGPRRREFRRDEDPRAERPRGPMMREPFDPEPPEPVFPEFREGPIYHAIWRRDGRILHSVGAPGDLQRPEPRPPSGPTVRERGDYREVTQFTPRGEVILAGRSMKDHAREFRSFGWLLAGSGAGVLLVGLAGGWWVATRAIQPIEEISAVAVKIASGDLSQRIAHQKMDSELGRLASVLNSTFERLDAAFNEQTQFTIDVSHELRTPVTVVLSQTQMALKRERSAAEYQETIEACQRAAQRMRRMIEALLQLARLDAGQETMRRETFDLAAVVRETVEMLRPLAAEKGLKFSLEGEAAHCTGDAEKVGQVIANLLTNALNYTPSGEIQVRTETCDGLAICRVSDRGMGIPEADLPHIFDRFYRVDQSRSRERGGTGLGLAISRSIINAHGGTIEVASQLGEGTTFTVRLPV